jgi:hypothetical protein
MSPLTRRAGRETLPRVDASDARWLRALVLRALRASAALPVALSLSACAATADQGPPEWLGSTLSICRDGQRRPLAPGMSLAREVDYLADRSGPQTLSERGAACGGAQDPGACLAAMTDNTLGQRHLLTTEGDDVRFWLPEASTGLLGEIDEVEEAVWLVEATFYLVDCDTWAADDDDGFVLGKVRRDDSECLGDEATVKLRVGLDATIEELHVAVDRSGGCAIPGRRPPGHCRMPVARTRSALGVHFARSAQLEAASVPAFAQIAGELRQHGAPARLIAAAQRAQRDEIRHARSAARLARRFGADPAAPRVAASKPRSLAALALDNVSEGCVFETYAALEASHQALAARDPVVRRTLRSVAADELRHAAFSHALHAWLCTKLDARTRDELDLARRQAASRLRASLLAGQDAPSLIAIAGLPARSSALALHAELAKTLWV